MGYIKTFEAFINEYWGSDDDARRAESYRLEAQCLKRFVDWARKNAGTRQVKLDSNNYVIDIVEIDGVKYKWYERGDNDNNWCNWNLYTNDRMGKVYSNSVWNIICINQNTSFIDSKNWNALFENLYTDYEQHPIDDKALYNRHQKKEMKEFDELD